MAVIIILMVCIASYFVISGTKKSANKDSRGKSSCSASLNMSIGNIEKVDKDYANEAIQFFDGYLSLCKKHKVIGMCALSFTGRDEFSIKTKMKCCITAIDDNHGDEEFKTLKRLWSEDGDSFIKSYFGCLNLHYVFCDADEYQFNNGQAIMAFERAFFTRGGEWLPTLKYIREELQKKWHDIQISVDKGGIVVK